MGPEGSVIEKKHIDDLVHNVVHRTIETRSNEKRITGEWLVYSKQATGNIYLCMATHTTGDQNIYDKVAYCCEHQFPLLEPFASTRSSVIATMMPNQSFQGTRRKRRAPELKR